MRTLLLGLVLALAAAASAIVIADRFAAGRSGTAEALERLETRLALLEARLPPATPVGGADPGPERPRRQATLAEAIQLLGEIQGMLLDMDRGFRANLTGVYERLLARFDEQAAPGTTGTAGREQLRAALERDGVRILDEEQMIEILDAEIAGATRVLEFLAVAEGGRAYESLLLVRARPMAIKLALEELGLVECEPDLETWSFAPSASGAFIYVLWDSRRTPLRAEDLILDRSTGETMHRTKWMFTASRWFTDQRTWERHYAADIYKNVASLTAGYAQDCILASPDPRAVDENNWAVHPEIAPPAGTKVRVFLTREPRPDWDRIR